MTPRESFSNLALRMAFLQGYLEGLTAYAWWKDGTQYVGASGTTLKEAIARAKREHGADTEE